MILTFLSKYRRQLTCHQIAKLTKYTSDLLKCDDLNWDEWNIICEALCGETFAISAAIDCLKKAANNLPATDCKLFHLIMLCTVSMLPIAHYLPCAVTIKLNIRYCNMCSD